MRGRWSDYAAPPVYLTREPPRSGVRFSREELRQLAVAILALSAAMTLLIVLGYQREGLLDPDALPLLVSVSFATSLVAVATGVGLHEIAHKVVAQRYGHWAEFRYNPMGLVLAFVFAAVGFLYGAPGATWISGTVTDEQNGRISAAGPLTNIVLGVGFLGILTTLGTVVTRPGLGDLARAIVNFATFVNLVLAGFNMIPVMPLDGAKVWAWNKVAYVGIVATVVGLFILGFVSGVLRV